MENINNLLKFPPLCIKKTKRTERGDLFDFFLSVLNPSRTKTGYKPMNHKRLAFLLQGIPTKDLYALQSKMTHAERRGFPASVVFWKEIKPQQSTPVT
jgi:hypothetical protein